MGFYGISMRKHVHAGGDIRRQTTCHFLTESSHLPRGLKRFKVCTVADTTAQKPHSLSITTLDYEKHGQTRIAWQKSVQLCSLVSIKSNGTYLQFSTLKVNFAPLNSAYAKYARTLIVSLYCFWLQLFDITYGQLVSSLGNNRLFVSQRPIPSKQCRWTNCEPVKFSGMWS